MKKAWKWILGIIIVLVVVAALVAAPFVMRRVMVANFGTARTLPQTQPQTGSGNSAPQPGANNGPMFRGNGGGWGPGRFNGRAGPMMMAPRNGGFNRGFAGFGFGFMFLGGLLRLIPLALLGLLLYGVYQLGKRSGLRSIPAQAAATQPSTAAPQAVPAAEPASENKETPAE